MINPKFPAPIIIERRCARCGGQRHGKRAIVSCLSADARASRLLRPRTGCPRENRGGGEKARSGFSVDRKNSRRWRAQKALRRTTVDAWTPGAACLPLYYAKLMHYSSAPRAPRVAYRTLRRACVCITLRPSYSLVLFLRLVRRHAEIGYEAAISSADTARGITRALYAIRAHARGSYDKFCSPAIITPAKDAIGTVSMRYERRRRRRRRQNQPFVLFSLDSAFIANEM